MQVENTISGIYREDNPVIYFDLSFENEYGEWEALDLSEMTSKLFLIMRKEIEDDEILYNKAVTIDESVTGRCSIQLTRAETKALWQKSSFQNEVGNNAVVCEIVYRDDEDETTYGQFWLSILPDIRRT